MRVLELTDRGVRPGPLGGSSSARKIVGTEASPSWGFSTLFGAAVVAAGGYHLALREADRWKGRGFSLGGGKPFGSEGPEFPSPPGTMRPATGKKCGPLASPTCFMV